VLDGVKATFLKTPYIITENLKKIFFHQKKEKKGGRQKFGGWGVNRSAGKNFYSRKTQGGGILRHF
jgi:hypothetical protein